MFRDIIQILLMLVMIFILKKSGFTIYGMKRKIKGYIKVTENENRKILITIRKKIFGIFDREKTYELKYVKIKNSIKEIESYFDIVLKNQEYILREVEADGLFDFRKKAVIYLRDSIPAFERLSIRFLPETELKNLIREMLELDIIELEESDFRTFAEKLNYNRLFRKQDK
ncbi:hypothetical protein EII29_01270 [Leptotrichia sp. OH3620_COT-345]|nr:hypothetical protein EII29_01270 [Leptotrichia sp. OH3620_COT-345]